MQKRFKSAFWLLYKGSRSHGDGDFIGLFSVTFAPIIRYGYIYERLISITEVYNS